MSKEEINQNKKSIEGLKETFSEKEIREQIKNFYKEEELPKATPVVLYLDDEVENLKAFKALFRREFKVFITDKVVEARKILDTEPISVLITDQRMPEMTGVRFLESIESKHKNQIRILLTGYSDIDVIIDAINKGKIYQYVSKPYRYEDMKSVIGNAYEVYYLRAKNRKLTEDITKANHQLEFLLRQKLLD